MKSVWIRILLISLMLLPVPFGCKDKNECLDLIVLPYYDIQGIVFSHVDKYHEYYVKDKKYLGFDLFSQDYANTVYPCESMALAFMVPDTLLMFHSQLNMKHRFGFTQEAFACNSKRPGYAGTRELVDKIYISSNYPFDETHPDETYDLSDIVDIFAYNTNGDASWKSLKEYNMNSPYEAPKRFFLLIKRKPTLSKTQQFVIKYYMLNQTGEATEYYIITTPVFQVE